MNKEIAMKISAIIVSAITIYTVIIWKPEENGEVLSKEINNITDVVADEEDDSISEFQIDELESSNEPEETSINSEENSTEGLGTIITNEKTFDEIISKVNLQEKKEIKEVLKKLSITDCSRIDKILSQEDNTKGVSEAFEFIQKRLPVEDYEKFQEIIGRYIDFTNVNSNL